MANEHISKIEATQTAQERLDLLHKFLTQLVDFVDVIEADEADELAFKSLNLKFGISEKRFTMIFESILNLPASIYEWHTIDKKVLPTKIEENNNLFLLRYARTLSYLEHGYVDYDAEEEFFYKLYDICLTGIHEINEIGRMLLAEKVFKNFLEAELNEKLNTLIADKYKAELKQSVEDFKKSYTKKIEDFYPRDYEIQEGRLHTINRQMEDCRAKHKSYNRWVGIPFASIVAKILISNNKEKFNKLQQQYKDTEKILSNYKEQAKKDRIADFQKRVNKFTEEKEAEIEQKIQANKTSIDMDKICPMWKNLKNNDSEFFNYTLAIAKLIEEIEKKDLYMLPRNFFEIDSREALAKHLPNYIMSGKASNLQEAVERYYLECCK